MTRWIFWITVLGVMITIGFTNVFSRSGTGEAEIELVIDPKPPLSIGVIPYLTFEALEAEVSPITSYLSEVLGRKVHINVASDYATLGRLLEGGRVQLALFSHASFTTLGIGRDWEVMCRTLRNGSAVYRGAVVVRDDSPYRDLLDLRGTRFAYVDKYSGSGFHYPNLLFKSRGMDPLTFFSQITFTKSHDQSIEGVRARRYDAAAVYDILEKGRSSAGLRVLVHTGWIPNDPIVVKKNFDPVLKAEIRKALLNMHEDPRGKGRMNFLTELRGTQRFVGEEEVSAIIDRVSGTSVESR